MDANSFLLKSAKNPMAFDIAMISSFTAIFLFSGTGV
jgi:hypothetical protein